MVYLDAYGKYEV